MNTKSALIIAVAILIGFSIEPILDRVDFSDPKSEVVYLKDSDGGERYIIAGFLNWKVEGGHIYAKDKRNNILIPLDQHSAKVGKQLIGD